MLENLKIQEDISVSPKLNEQGKFGGISLRTNPYNNGLMENNQSQPEQPIDMYISADF